MSARIASQRVRRMRSFEGGEPGSFRSVPPSKYSSNSGFPSPPRTSQVPGRGIRDVSKILKVDESELYALGARLSREMQAWLSERPEIIAAIREAMSGKKLVLKVGK